jgi:phosphohistidine phosphatase SixA
LKLSPQRRLAECFSYGAHLHGSLGAHGQEQVDRLRDALQLRGVRPSVFLVSLRPQANDTYCRLVGTGTLFAPRELSAALTPEDASAGLDALIRSTKADLEREPAVVLISHEGRLSNPLTELTGARHRPFSEAGAVSVTAGSVQDLLRGDGRL